jgi:hypothetical protein
MGGLKNSKWVRLVILCFIGGFLDHKTERGGTTVPPSPALIHFDWERQGAMLSRNNDLATDCPARHAWAAEIDFLRHSLSLWLSSLREMTLAQAFGFGSKN